MKIGINLVLFLFFICFCINVNAFGIASPYLENNEMTLSPGESRDYKIEIQNVDPSEIKVKFFLESNITRMVDEKEYFLVGNKTPIQEIVLRVTLPENAKPGEEFKIKYGAYPLSSSDAPVSLSIRLNKEFTVKTIGEMQERSTKKESLIYTTAIITLILITLSIVITLLLRKSHIYSKKRFK
jgi:hypothetical protein